MDCRGCNSKGICTVSYKLAKEGGLTCPCRLCLVKPVCGEDCNEYYEFRENYEQSIKGITLNKKGNLKFRKIKEKKK